MLHHCQFDELSSGVGSPCLPATLANLHALYRKMSPPLFLQSTHCWKKALFRRKQKQSVDFHITFSNKLRPSPPSSWRGWCWCERIVNIFSFTPSGATRPCAALIIVLFFSLSFPPNVQYSVRFFLERLFFSCLFIFYPENAIAGSMRLIFFYCVWNYVNGLQLVLEDLSSITF